MQLHIEYACITSQIFTDFHQQFKCFNHECLMPIAHSVFKQTVLTSCSNTRSNSVVKWYNCQLSMNSWSKSFCIVDKMVFYLSITLAIFGMCLW